jgi:recombination protein RecT
MNAVAQQTSRPMSRADQIKAPLLNVQKQIQSLLGDKDRANKFMAASLVVASEPNLAKCSPDSIVQALVGVAMSDLNIDRNLGQCYLVPYGDKVQLQIGYKGLIQLLFRAGWLVKAFPVYHCDSFDMSFDGWDNKVMFHPAIDDRDEGDRDWVFNQLRGVYVVARHADTKDEYSTFVNKSVIEKLRLNSQNQRASQYTKPDDRKRLESGMPIGIWADWYIEMALAKSIKKLAKILPIGDSRAQTAIAIDDKQDQGVVVDYAKTIESGVVSEAPKARIVEVDDLLNKSASVVDIKPVADENIDLDTGEINDIDDPHGELKQQILDCQTKSDIGRLYASLKEPLKSELKPIFQERQEQINGVTTIDELPS